MMMKICCNIIKTRNKAKDDGHNESMQCLIFMLSLVSLLHLDLSIRFDAGTESSVREAV